MDTGALETYSTESLSRLLADWESKLRIRREFVDEAQVIVTALRAEQERREREEF